MNILNHCPQKMTMNVYSIINGISLHCRLMQQVDGDGLIYFDVFENGYTGVNECTLGHTLTKANYKEICKYAQSVLDEFYAELDVDYSEDDWEQYN